MTFKKWYSHGLTEKATSGLTLSLARIGYPDYGINSSGDLTLQFKLHRGSDIHNFELKDYNDIRNLLFETNCKNVSQLAGKTIEIWLDEKSLRGISVSKI